MEHIKRVWLMNAWRDEQDNIWSDSWSFKDEVRYRKEHGIAANHNRDFTKEDQL